MNKAAIYISLLAMLLLAILYFIGTNSELSLLDSGSHFLSMDYTIFTFIGYAIPMTLVLFLAEIPILMVKRIFHKDVTVWIYLIVIALIKLSILNHILLTQIDQYWLEFIKQILHIIPVFLVYQWVFRWQPNKYEIADKEALKFTIIFIGLNVTHFLSFQLSTILGYPKEIQFMDITMSIAFSFYIALGNLIFNLIKYSTSLIGSSKKLKFATQEILSSQSELNSIQSSVNPHFLYNSLNSIAALAKEDPDRTQKMALALSAFYKYNTNREEKHFSTIKKEIEMLHHYLEIEKIRFEERLQFNIEVEEGLVNEKIPHFLFQPLLENAIKYGYNIPTNKISIYLNIKKHGNTLEIYIYDNGPDFRDDMKKGYGLSSVTKKLKLLYPEKHEITFINHPKKHVLINITQK